MATRQLKVALLANLKKNAPHVHGEAPDAHDDLDSEKTLSALKSSLEACGHQVRVFEGNIDVVTPLRRFKPDIAFNICEMHWGDSREAQIPAILEMLRIPYTGSKLLTMALTQDKTMTKRGHIEVDERSNTMIVTDISDKLDQVDAMIRNLDTRTPQVEIVARLVDVDVSATRDLGIKWGLHNTDLFDAGVQENVDVNANDVTGPAGVVTLGTIKPFGSIDATLQALETANKANIISNPRITTVNNREASVVVGKQIPLIVQDFAGNAVTQLTTIGIKLSVTPHINTGNRITMDVHPEVSDLASQATVQGGIIINTTMADTRVMVNDGETAVIGGLIRSNESTLKRGIPVLMDIPLLGNLFRSSSTTKQKRELLIFVTPKILGETASRE